MHRTSRQPWIVLAAALGIAPLLAAAAADNEQQSGPVTAALGVKAGIIPPVLAVPEVVLHGPHFLLGAFGIVTGGGLGDGGRRTTLGAEVGYEAFAPGQSTPYLLGSFFHYEAAADAAGFYERSNVMTCTGGYEWKARRFELQVGAGLLFLLSNEKPAPVCSGLGCVDIRLSMPWVAPTFDLAARFRF